MGPGGEGWGLPLFLSVIKSGKIVQSNVKSGYVTLADMSKDRAVDATRLSLAARSLMNTARCADHRGDGTFPIVFGYISYQIRIVLYLNVS